MEIPHIETRWDFLLRRDDYSINLYPNPKIISRAYVDLIESFGWKSFTILYQVSKWQQECLSVCYVNSR